MIHKLPNRVNTFFKTNVLLLTGPAGRLISGHPGRRSIQRQGSHRSYENKELGCEILSGKVASGRGKQLVASLLDELRGRSEFSGEENAVAGLGVIGVSTISYLYSVPPLGLRYTDRMLKPSRFVLALSLAVPAASQQVDWLKVNEEAMRNYQSLVQIDSTTTEVGVAAFVKKTLEAEGIAVSAGSPSWRCGIWHSPTRLRSQEPRWQATRSFRRTESGWHSGARGRLGKCRSTEARPSHYATAKADCAAGVGARMAISWPLSGVTRAYREFPKAADPHSL
jgi:hypothetical protein